jgi:hypothetical protein
MWIYDKIYNKKAIINNIIEYFFIKYALIIIKS